MHLPCLAKLDAGGTVSCATCDAYWPAPKEGGALPDCVGRRLIPRGTLAPPPPPPAARKPSPDYSVEEFAGGRAVLRFGIWEIAFVFPHDAGRKVGAYWNVHLPGQSERARPAPSPEVALERARALVEEWLREAGLVRKPDRVER